MYATNRLSGDQNTLRRAPSVPDSALGWAASSARTHTWLRPDAPIAVNAIKRPSGETAGGPRAVLPSGAATSKRTTGGTCGARRVHANANAAAATAATAATPQARRSRVRRRTVTTAGRPTRDPP